MVVVQLMGGMGNQMFQYAFGKRLAFENNLPLKLDLNFLLDRTPRENFVFRDYDLDIFNLEASILTEEERALFLQPAGRIKTWLGIEKGVKRVQENGPAYNNDYLVQAKRIFAVGYWQSEKYFDGIKTDLLRDFTFRNSLNAAQRQLLEQVNEQVSVCMNFRRTDYVDVKGSAETHGFTGMEYYSKAVDYLKDKLGEFCLYVFSDDIDWCRQNVSFDVPTTFVGHEFKGVKFAAYLELMIACKHFIIPNSFLK